MTDENIASYDQGDVSIYGRVSTTDQNLDRQNQLNAEYAEKEFDVDLAEIEFYRDKSTGTNTERSGYREMMEDAENGEIGLSTVSVRPSREANLFRNDPTARRMRVLAWVR